MPMEPVNIKGEAHEAKAEVTEAEVPAAMTEEEFKAQQQLHGYLVQVEEARVDVEKTKAKLAKHEEQGKGIHAALEDFEARLAALEEGRE
jgi:hypothetical protein